MTIGAEVSYEHVAVYIEDTQANLDLAGQTLTHYDYGFVSAYCYDKLTLIVD